MLYNTIILISIPLRQLLKALKVQRELPNEWDICIFYTLDRIIYRRIFIYRPQRGIPRPTAVSKGTEPISLDSSLHKCWVFLPFHYNASRIVVGTGLHVFTAGILNDNSRIVARRSYTIDKGFPLWWRLAVTTESTFDSRDWSSTLSHQSQLWAKLISVLLFNSFDKGLVVVFGLKFSTSVGNNGNVWKSLCLLGAEQPEDFQVIPDELEVMS